MFDVTTVAVCVCILLPSKYLHQTVQTTNVRARATPMIMGNFSRLSLNESKREQWHITAQSQLASRGNVDDATRFQRYDDDEQQQIWRLWLSYHLIPPWRWGVYGFLMSPFFCNSRMRSPHKQRPNLIDIFFLCVCCVFINGVSAHGKFEIELTINVVYYVNVEVARRHFHVW